MSISSRAVPLPPHAVSAIAANHQATTLNRPEIDGDRITAEKMVDSERERERVRRQNWWSRGNDLADYEGLGRLDPVRE